MQPKGDGLAVRSTSPGALRFWFGDLQRLQSYSTLGWSYALGFRLCNDGHLGERHIEDSLSISPSGWR